MRRLGWLSVMFLALVAMPVDAVIVNQPTDAANPFRKINLHSRIADRNVSDGVDVPAYPASVDSSSLLVLRSSGDSVALFNSTPHNGIGLSSLLPERFISGFAQFSLGARATSAGLLTVGSVVTNGPGPWADFGKTLQWIVAYYANGDSATDSLIVGKHIRNFQSGTVGCSDPYPTYTTLPTDTLHGEVWSGTQDGTQYFYDVQEMRLPISKRGRTITSIEVRADSINHDPGCAVLATSAVFGLSLWNKFAILSPSNAAVVLQRQNDAVWGSDLYGGYTYNSSVVGGDRTISALGCLLACMSMANQYYGVPCTARTLNQWLQGHLGGYGGMPVASIKHIDGTGAIGDTVRFRLKGDAIKKRGPSFLIERGQYMPLATVDIVRVNSGDSTGVGVISHRYIGGTMTTATDSIGIVYNQVNTIKASYGFSSGVWGIASLGKGTTAPNRAESTLAIARPVVVYTRLSASNKGQHWVLASGREPHFTSATDAVGTYRIADPFYSATQLSRAPFNNKFTEARACTLVAGGPQPVAGQERMSSIGDPSFTLALSGPATLEVTDPMGRMIVYDSVTDNYASSIPDADCWRGFVVEDATDTTSEDGAVDIIEVPTTTGGNYLVRITGQQNGEYVLRASAPAGSGPSASGVVFGTISAGASKNHHVIYSPGSATVDMFPTAVNEEHSVPDPRLRLHPNPTMGGTTIAFYLAKPGATRLAVFDLAGRRVRTLHAGDMGAGAQQFEWDGYDAAGRKVEPGAYVIRLETSTGATATRVMVLK